VIILTADKELNILIYGTPSTGVTNFKNGPAFFADPVHTASRSTYPATTDYLYCVEMADKC